MTGRIPKDVRLSNLGFEEQISLGKIRAGNRVGRVGLGRAKSGPGQNRAGPKLARFFRAKNLIAQPALKTRMVGPNSLLKAKKIQAGRAGPYRAGPYWAWPNLARFFSGQ